MLLGGSNVAAAIRAVDENEARGHMEAAGCSAEEFIEVDLPLEEA